jgi:hypothetical protein
MSRADIPENQRKDFCLYVDEFQNFSTESFATILSESRKYGLNLMVANQFITQLSDEVRESVFGNIGTVIAHRVGTSDAEVLEKYFRPLFDVDDLQKLPTANSIVRTLIGGVPTQPFSMADLPILGHSNKQLAEALKQLSAAKYGRPQAIVEAEIFKRLKTEEPPRPSFAASPYAGGAYGGNTPLGGMSSNSNKPATQGLAKSSFFEEWLAKRQASGATVSPKDNANAGSFDHPSARHADTKNKETANYKSDQFGQNISSNIIDSKEITSIADQLKQGATDQQGKKDLGKKSDDVLRHDDTILIDREGNLSYSDKDQS